MRNFEKAVVDAIKEAAPTAKQVKEVTVNFFLDDSYADLRSNRGSIYASSSDRKYIESATCCFIEAKTLTISLPSEREVTANKLMCLKADLQKVRVESFIKEEAIQDAINKLLALPALREEELVEAVVTEDWVAVVAAAAAAEDEGSFKP